MMELYMLTVDLRGLNFGEIHDSNRDDVVRFHIDVVDGFLACVYPGGFRVSQRVYKPFEAHLTDELEEFARSGYCNSIAYPL